MQLVERIPYADEEGQLFVRNLPEPGLIRKDLSATRATGATTDTSNPRIGRHVAFTSEHIDDEGDIIRAGGIDVSKYQTNPIVLLMHGRTADFPVIGGNAQIERAEVDGAPGWVCREFLFADSPLARTINGMWNDLILRMTSIAVVPVSWHPIDKAGARLNPEDPTAMQHQRGYEYAESVMREFSIVTIPVNPHAARRLGDAAYAKAAAYFDLGAVTKTQPAPWSTPTPTTPEPKPLPAQEVTRLLKSTSFERCHGCKGANLYFRDLNQFVDHWNPATSVICAAPTITPTGPTLKAVADGIRTEVHAGVGLRAFDGLVEELESLPPAVARVLRGAVAVLKAGRVLSAETRTQITGALSSIVAATANMGSATDEIRDAAGALEAFLASTDQPPPDPVNPEPEAAPEAEASVRDAGSVLTDLFSDPRVVAAAQRISAESASR